MGRNNIEDGIGVRGESFGDYGGAGILAAGLYGSTLASFSMVCRNICVIYARKNSQR